MRILSVDPGTHSMGWAVFDGGKYEASGLILSKRQSLQDRLFEMKLALGDVIGHLHPGEGVKKVVMEDIPFCKNKRTYFALGHVACVVLLVAAERGLKVDVLPVSAWKQSFTGKGSAAKEEVAAMAETLFGVKPTMLQRPKSKKVEWLYDETDAVGIGSAWFGLEVLR